MAELMTLGTYMKNCEAHWSASSPRTRLLLNNVMVITFWVNIVVLGYVEVIQGAMTLGFGENRSSRATALLCSKREILTSQSLVCKESHCNFRIFGYYSSDQNFDVCCEYWRILENPSTMLLRIEKKHQ